MVNIFTSNGVKKITTLRDHISKLAIQGSESSKAQAQAIMNFLNCILENSLDAYKKNGEQLRDALNKQIATLFGNFVMDVYNQHSFAIAQITIAFFKNFNVSQDLTTTAKALIASFDPTVRIASYIKSLDSQCKIYLQIQRNTEISTTLMTCRGKIETALKPKVAAIETTHDTQTAAALITTFNQALENLFDDIWALDLPWIGFASMGQIIQEKAKPMLPELEHPRGAKANLIMTYLLDYEDNFYHELGKKNIPHLVIPKESMIIKKLAAKSPAAPKIYNEARSEYVKLINTLAESIKAYEKGKHLSWLTKVNPTKVELLKNLLLALQSGQQSEIYLLGTINFKEIKENEKPQGCFGTFEIGYALALAISTQNAHEHLIRIQSRLSRGQAGEILANLITDLMFMFNQYGIETDPFVVAAISSYQKQHAVEKFTAA